MITAQLKTYRQSPRKVRLVTDLVKGKNVTEALQILTVAAKEAALPLKKLILSAVRSAKNSFDIDEKSLFVKDFRVDAGTVLKRSMPRARGSAYPILKRTCHVSLVLEEKTSDSKKEIANSKK